MAKDKSKAPKSIYSYGGTVIDENNVDELNHAMYNPKWRADCFVVEVPCTGWMCRKIKQYLTPGGKVFAKYSGPMGLFLQRADIENKEEYDAWTLT